MRNVGGIAALLAIAIPEAPLAENGVWSLDPARTRVSFSVRGTLQRPRFGSQHLVVEEVKGEFTRTSARVRLDERDLSKSSVETTVEAASVDTHEAGRDQHLKSPEFLDVERCPYLQFKSTKVEGVEAGRLKVSGELTIRCTSKPVTFYGDLGAPTHDSEGTARRRFAAKVEINRRNFGVNWGNASEATPAVSDDVAIHIEAELVKAEGSPVESK